MVEGPGTRPTEGSGSDAGFPGTRCQPELGAGCACSWAFGSGAKLLVLGEAGDVGQEGAEAGGAVVTPAMGCPEGQACGPDPQAV